MAAATMAVAAAAVATTAAAALTLGGKCGGRSVGEAESYKGGMVLHLQASGVGVGRGAVNKPTEDGAGEWEGGDRCCHRGFDGGGHGLPSPPSTLSSPTSTTMTMTTTTTMMMTTTRARSQGGGRDNKKMGF
jgi:hypothetical protein